MRLRNFILKNFNYDKIWSKKIEILSISTILVFTILTILGIFQVLNIKTQYNLRQFFPNYHPLLRQDDQVRKRFQMSDENSPFLLVATLKGDEDWSNTDYLDIVKILTEQIRKIPHVSGVQNISTLQGAVQSKEGLGVGSVIDYIAPNRFFAELKRNPILSPLFISKDAKILTVFVTTTYENLNDLEVTKNKILKTAQDTLPFAEVSLGGIPAIQSDINRILSREVVQFIVLAFFMCLLALALIFKNIPPILICTVVAFITNILSVWGISLFGFSFNILSSTIPILVTMTVISIAIHSIMRVIENQRKNPSSPKYQKVVIQTFRDIFRPNLLTALTTSVGFFTLTLSDSPIIKEYGLSVAIALMVTWINTAALLPAFLLLSKKPVMREWMSGKARWPFFIMKYHKTILITTLLLSIFGAWRGQHLSWKAKLFDDLPEGHEVRKTTELVDQSLGGLIPLDIEVRLPSGENPWGTEDSVRQLNFLTRKIREKKGVGSALSIADILQASGLKTGKNKATASEIMFLLSMSNENPLKNFMSLDNKSTRISIRLSDIPGHRMWNLVQDIRKATKEFFPTARVRLSGTAAYVHDINNALSKELLYGFWQAMLVIFVLLIFSYKSVAWSFLACLPNLTPPALLLGALSVFEVPIKPGIAIILSISLGLAFNNTVYLLERMRHMLAKGHSYQKALFHTFWSEANPCFFSSMVLIVGFAAFAVSYFKMNQLFGVFMVFSVLAGLLGDLVFLPALLQFLLERGSRFLKAPRLPKAILIPFLASAIFAGSRPAQAQVDIKTLGTNMQNMLATRDESGKIDMKIIENDGSSKKREITFSRLHDNENHFTLMRMVAPKDIKGTALLSVIKDGHEEKWIYLPSSKSTRKLSTSDSNAKILDSELYTEDFDIAMIKSSTSKITKTEADTTLVVESLVKNPKSSYGKTLSWIGRDNLIKKSELYDKKGALLKTISFPKYLQVAKGKWRAQQILIENVQNKRKTELVFSDMKVNLRLKEKDFSTRALAEAF